MSSYHELSDNDWTYKEERKAYLHRFVYCRICKTRTKRTDRSIDHIIPMWRFTGKYWDKRNWQMLCVTCSRAKTKIEGQP